VCARGAWWALLCGPSTSPLGSASSAVPHDPEFTLDDPPPTPGESARNAALTEDQRRLIDTLLLKNSSVTWRKMARIIASAMLEVPAELRDISDSYFAGRLRQLVGTGQLESRGYLAAMRYCELRLRNARET
jgi:uncharacterized protein DUF3658